MFRLRRPVSTIAALALIGTGIAAASVTTSVNPAAATAPAPLVAYDSRPNPLPGNIPSVGFEATSMSEFGDHVSLARSGRLGSADVIMSSWACQSGSGVTCSSTPGATFNHPITLNVYAVNPGPVPTVGTKLLTKTQTFAIAYRPTADPACPSGGWSAPDCFNGFAQQLTFDMTSATGPGANAALPTQVIWTIAYNTSDYGATPLRPQACNVTNNCPYDSLNVGAKGTGASVGTDVDPDGAFQNSSFAGFYCDGGPGGTLRLDTGTGTPCGAGGDWTGFTPTIRLNVLPNTVVVGPNNLAPNGAFAVDPTIGNPGTVGFVSGPGAPPSGTGSLHMAITTGQHASLNSYAYGACNNSPTCAVPSASWTKLNTITAFSFSTYRQSGTSNPSLTIQISPTGDGSDFASLVFLPNALSNNTWQTWDSMNPSDGTWVSTRNLGTAPFNCAAFTCSASWSQIQSSTFFNTARVSLGIGVQVGTDSTFDGSVDALTLGIGTNVVTYDFEANGSIGLPVISTQNVDMPEGNAPGFALVPVALSKASSNVVSVAYQTRTNSANLGDFSAASGFLTFVPGQTVNFIAVPVSGDAVAERYERFFVDLKTPSNGTLLGGGAKITSTVTLQNDDVPKLIIANRSTTEAGSITIPVKLNFPYYKPIVVTLTTANNTAIAPGDYDTLAPGTTLTFPTNTKGPQNAVLNVKADTVVEPLEKFGLTATSPSVQGPRTITVTIKANAS